MLPMLEGQCVEISCVCIRMQTQEEHVRDGMVYCLIGKLWQRVEAGLQACVGIDTIQHQEFAYLEDHMVQRDGSKDQAKVFIKQIF